MPPGGESVDETYFNDLSRQPTLSAQNSASPLEQTGSCENGDDAVPKTKRIACVICRKRKLKCDGGKPKCATCARLGHNCAYDEIRRKSGPKRGYVKELEARLAQVETQLKGKGPKKGKATSAASVPAVPAVPMENSVSETMWQPDEPMMSVSTANGIQQMQAMGGDTFNTMPTTGDSFTLPITSMAPNIPDGYVPDVNLGLDDNFSWEMIGLGLEEPMPSQEAVNELTAVYFDKIHPSLPMLHRYRYQASMDLAPMSRPPIALRYIMWTHAAAITDQYMHHQDIFYRRARKYLELDEMKGCGESFVTLAHCQAWSLVSAYEFKMMHFPRAWMSVGRASRMALMLGLNRLDGIGLDVKQCLPPPRDWTEREERRRTFWMAYCVDRYASIGTGWPMSIDEKDIKTHLPASEESYENSTPQRTPPLNEAMTQDQVSALSSFAGVVYVTHFFGLNLIHLHRPEPQDEEDNLQGPFWKRHRRMDNVLLNTSLSLPSHLRLPSGIRNPNIVFLNFAIHTSAICLHQAAIFKVEKHQLPSNLMEQSRARCVLAAMEIANVMRLTSHLDVAGMNPFMAFCLYVAARVFVQYLKKMPNDQEMKQSLEFLLTAMSAIRRKNPLTESFLIQLTLDMEGSGLDTLLHNPDFSSKLMDEMRARVPPAMHGGSCEVRLDMIETESGPENRSPEDLRFPDWRGGKDSSNSNSMHSDPPAQTQYAYRPIDLAAQRTQQQQPFYPQNVSNQQQAWTDQAQSNGPTGLNPIINNNINVNGFDQEMSDNSSSSRGPSSGLTPQSMGTNSTSNTTYSPPQVQEEEISAAPNPSSMPSISGPDNYYSSMFTRQASTSGMKSPASGDANNAMQQDPFKVPPEWEMNSTSTPSFSGMSPDGGWEKMMQSMSGWDGSTGMTPK